MPYIKGTETGPWKVSLLSPSRTATYKKRINKGRKAFSLVNRQI